MFQQMAVVMPPGVMPGQIMQRPGGYAPPPPRQQYQPPPPVRQQPQYSGKLANTGSPVGRSLGAAPCNENCWKCVCGCYSPCCCLCLTQKVAQVRTGEVGVVESFGKYQRLAEPGENLLYAPLGSLVEFEKIAEDDHAHRRDRVRDAAYKLDNVPTQLQDYVESTIRTLVSKVKIDDVFTLGKELRKAVLDEAAAKMLERA
ncbi:hypothetical protein JL720_16146 [Aureococcus anophagefferens]|nr:hypothetical protein JL720_16146 [Aureococcus anophagefferens]